jgi:hypothetical protein
LPTHWLGRAEEPLLELEPPVAPELVEPPAVLPEPVEPEPEPIDEPLELESLDPEVLGLVVELDPEPEVLGLVVELDPELPPTLGLEVELPLLPLPELPALPELCAHDTVARPSRAAATAALSCFAITMILSFG